MKKNPKQFFISCKECIIENPRSFYGSFYLGPFKASQSLTIANALRRTLLSELTGFGITSICIEGANHEYSTLKGVHDSVLDILLNMKEIVFKSSFKKNQNVFKPKSKIQLNTFIGYLQVRGPGIVRAGDLKLPVGIQCVDPDQYIATLSTDGVLSIKFTLREGQNYLIQNSKMPDFSFEKISEDEIFDVQKKNSKNVYPSYLDSKKVKNSFNLENRQNEDPFQKSNSKILSLDPVFMPINKVNYVIELDELGIQSNPRVNDTSNTSIFDQNHVVILEIWTNGSIHPREALFEGIHNLALLFTSLGKTNIFQLSGSEMFEKSSSNYLKLFDLLNK